MVAHQQHLARRRPPLVTLRAGEAQLGELHVGVQLLGREAGVVPHVHVKRRRHHVEVDVELGRKVGVSLPLALADGDVLWLHVLPLLLLRLAALLVLHRDEARLLLRRRRRRPGRCHPVAARNLAADVLEAAGEQQAPAHLARLLVKVPEAVDVAQALALPPRESERDALGHVLVRVIVEEDVLGNLAAKVGNGRLLEEREVVLMLLHICNRGRRRK